MEWWLLERDIRRQGARVRGALEQLVAEGLVRHKQGPDGRTHYAVDPDKLREIRGPAGSE